MVLDVSTLPYKKVYMGTKGLLEGYGYLMANCMQPFETANTL
jgi:hypothetical protein